MDESINLSDEKLRLGPVVSLCNRSDLFETLTNERVAELSRQKGTSGFSGPGAVLRSTGVAQRRILRADVSPLNLTMELMRQFTQSTGLGPSEFAHIFLCHSHASPTAALQLAGEYCELAQQDPASVSAVNPGCTGFLRLLSMATRFLQTNHTATRVLLLNIETPDLWHCSADRLFCGIIGAGATATVLQRDTTSHVQSAACATLALQDIHVQDVPVPLSPNVSAEPLFFRETGSVFSFHGNAATRTVMRMNAEAVFLHGIERMLQALRNAVQRYPVRHGQRVIVIPHQPGGKLLRALIAAATQEFPEFQFVNNLLNHGNTISSTIPLCLAHLREPGQLGPAAPCKGDRVILIASGICMDRMNDRMAMGYASLDCRGD